MTVQNDRKSNLVALECDRCGELSEEFDSSDFREMTAAAKRAGWFTEKKQDEWQHYCPVCARKGPKSEFKVRP